ncbi:uncharacterized protein LOC113353332 isoform X2 [Papaver somniferum]|uniref:uncharacterized protein LOC113353332 isoform X2 n=1 Tax=Papaver somniferum TaxID=3469 RepID=UPI000E70283E|nr:uncharacterized protein LOC113353332 isoform X2 [Papaver somniferum]
MCLRRQILTTMKLRLMAPRILMMKLFPAESGGVPLKVKGNGKVVISKYTTKNPSKKRKLFSPSPLNTSSYDDALPLPDNSASVSSMVDLSSIFSDTISGVDNDALGHECDFVVKICDAPSLRHDSLRGVASALTPSFQFSFGSLSLMICIERFRPLERRILSS